MCFDYYEYNEESEESKEVAYCEENEYNEESEEDAYYYFKDDMKFSIDINYLGRCLECKAQLGLMVVQPFDDRTKQFCSSECCSDYIDKHEEVQEFLITRED